MSPSTDRYAEAPQLVVLKNAQGMELTVMDWGATWLSCLVPLANGQRREVLLGCPRAEDYSRQSAFLGATVGRYANRIAGAKLPYGNLTLSLLPSQGENQLHGGPDGFDKRRWEVVAHDAQHVRFRLASPDGDQGFPGNLVAEVTYTLTDDNTVEIDMQANTDAACPVNLTNHAYFNLDGGKGTVHAHTLQVQADQVLPTDGMGIPYGHLQSVTGTTFDFRAPHTVGERLGQDGQQQLAKGYDHSFLLNAGADWAARVESSDKALTMTLSTSLPALQFYSGNYLGGTLSREGGEYADYAGLALEPQFLPDSPHHPEWPQPSCWLEPGQKFHHWIQYQFR